MFREKFYRIPGMSDAYILLDPSEAGERLREMTVEDMRRRNEKYKSSEELDSLVKLAIAWLINPVRTQ